MSTFSWGKNQVGTSSDDQFWRNKLKKNLISKIRYTNMASDEFTKVVVPTGFLSAEESLSVYSYLCADEATRLLNSMIMMFFCLAGMAYNNGFNS